MKFNWYSKTDSNPIATIYDSNITLNKPARGHFETAYSVMLGFDTENKVIAIKPLTKDVDTLGHIPEDKKYKISVWQSYARISNKLFIDSVAENMGINFKKVDPHKYKCSWDSKEQLLRVHLKEEYSL